MVIPLYPFNQASPSMTCVATGCRRGRTKRGRFCKPHAKRLNAYGHPLGRPLPRNWLVHFGATALRAIDANQDHPGIRLALNELQALLSNPRAHLSGSHSGNAADHLTRLAVDNTEPRHVLAMVAGVVLFDSDQPGFIKGSKAYRFAVARAVCSLAPRHRSMPLGSRALEAIGSWMVDHYASLLAVIVKAVEAAEREAKERAAVMSAPLTPSP